MLALQLEKKSSEMEHYFDVINCFTLRSKGKKAKTVSGAGDLLF